ncbi:hypothetical protein Tco_1321173 [Tanacetum coccineum]
MHNNWVYTPNLRAPQLYVDLFEYHFQVISIYKLKDVSETSHLVFSLLVGVCLCARFQEDPKTAHLEAVKCIFRYIKGTTNLGLWYRKGTGIETVVYADSDHAGDYVDQKALTVFIHS